MRGAGCFVTVVRGAVPRRTVTLAVIVAALVAMLGPAVGTAPCAIGPAVATAAEPASRPSMTVHPGPAGSFALPTAPPAVVLTPFVPPATRYGSGHRGVDLAAGVGAEVRAAADGVVVFAGVLADRGVVSVQHAGGLRTTYEPVDAIVAAGDVVARGDLLGTLTAGHASCAPASCLHFGARLPDRVYLDPMALFAPWHVRLKPWAGSVP